MQNEIPQRELWKLVRKAEMALQKQGNLASAVEGIVSEAKEKGFSANPQKARGMLVELMAELCKKDLKDQLESMRQSMRY